MKESALKIEPGTRPTVQQLADELETVRRALVAKRGNTSPASAGTPHRVTSPQRGLPRQRPVAKTSVQPEPEPEGAAATLATATAPTQGPAMTPEPEMTPSRLLAPPSAPGNAGTFNRFIDARGNANPMVTVSVRPLPPPTHGHALPLALVPARHSSVFCSTVCFTQQREVGLLATRSIPASSATLFVFVMCCIPCRPPSPSSRPPALLPHSSPGITSGRLTPRPCCPSDVVFGW